MLIFNTFNMIAGAVAVFSGYFASFFCCIGMETADRKRRMMRRFLTGLLVFYIVMLTDFTLIDDSFGRNIYNVLDWNKEAFSKYLKESTNIIPFATVRLFIRGYINEKLSLSATVVNLLGNFTAFMPIPFFIGAFGKGKYRPLKVFLLVLAFVLCVELLQLAFLTGACDIDDVILNTSGAMLFYFISRNNSVSKGIKKLTFGVWKIQ